MPRIFSFQGDRLHAPLGGAGAKVIVRKTFPKPLFIFALQRYRCRVRASLALYRPTSMSTPLSILEGKLKQARRAYADVERSMRLRGGILRHGIRKDPAGTARDDYSYRHNGLEWRCKVLVSGQEIRTHALHWWLHGPKGHRNEALDAILLRSKGMPLHFDSHFFSRWGLRSELMGVMLTNMMGFFKQYHDLPMRSLKRIHNGHAAWGAAIAQGMVHGHMNGTRLLSCDTFISLEMMDATERSEWERLRKAEADKAARRLG